MTDKNIAETELIKQKIFEIIDEIAPYSSTEDKENFLKIVQTERLQPKAENQLSEEDLAKVSGGVAFANDALRSYCQGLSGQSWSQEDMINIMVEPLVRKGYSTEYIEAEKAKHRAKFANMKTLIDQMNAQSAWLASQFGY